MQVRELCSREAVTVEVVVEGTRPVGILTDRDIVVAVIAVPGARPEGIRVCDAMQTRLALAREDDGVFEAAQRMREREAAERRPLDIP